MKKIRHPKSVTNDIAAECFSRHLPYEINMLRELYPELLSGHHSRLLHNAHIEAFLIHARNLIEFFKNKPPCDFDPRLFTDTSYEPNRNFINTDLLSKINQQVAHLTASRTANALKQLGPNEWLKIKNAIENEISRFEKSLLPIYKPTWNSEINTITTTVETPSATNIIGVA